MSEIPIVRRQLNEGAAMVVGLFEAAKRFEPARQAQWQFIQQYSVPPVIFKEQ
jgi:hypothetical protein